MRRCIKPQHAAIFLVQRTSLPAVSKFYLIAFLNIIVNGVRELFQVVRVDTVDTDNLEEMTRDEHASPDLYNFAQLCGRLLNISGICGMWDRFQLLDRESDRERRKL